MPSEKNNPKTDSLKKPLSVDLYISYLWLCNKLYKLISSKQHILFISQFLCVKNPGMDWLDNSGSGLHKITWPGLHSSLDSTEVGESTSKLNPKLVAGSNSSQAIELRASVLYWLLARGFPQFLSMWILSGVARNIAASFHHNEQMREQQRARQTSELFCNLSQK